MSTEKPAPVPTDEPAEDEILKVEGEEEKGEEPEVWDADTQEEKVHIRIRGKVTTFVLRELLSSELSKWRKGNSGRVRLDRGRTVTVNDSEGVEESLISKCLFTEGGKPVPRSTIEGWGSSVVQMLFSKCVRINGLDEEAMERAKKA